MADRLHARLRMPAYAALFLSPFAMAFGSLSAKAAPPMPANMAGKIDAFATSAMRRMHIPGLSLAIVKSGKVVYAKGYGFANVELSVRAKPATIYPIGSLSKQFTATSILILAQEGKLDIDTRFSSLLPNLKLPTTWSAITIRQLLDQTSGIPAYTEYAPMDPNKNPMWKTWTPQEIVDIVSARPLAFTPGARFQYSNTNYYLLALVVRAVSGEDVYPYMHERLFRPLGMTSTQQFDATTIIPGRSARYLYAGGSVINNFLDMDPSYFAGDGGIESSVLDLAKWDAALYRPTPLTEATKRAMWTAPKTAQPAAMVYGFGWVLERINGHRLIWHNGAIPGAMAWMGRYADDKLTVIALCNVMNVDDLSLQIHEMHTLGTGIAGIVNPLLAPAQEKQPASLPNSPVDASDLAVCKKAFDNIVAGSADPNMYTADAAKALFPDRIAQTTSLLKSVGALHGFHALSERSQNGSVIVTCRAAFDVATLTYDFYLDPATKKIQGILPRP